MEITSLLKAWSEGDRARARFAHPIIYDDLHRRRDGEMAPAGSSSYAFGAEIKLKGQPL